MNFLIKEKLYIKKIMHYKNIPIHFSKQRYSTLPDKLKKKLNFEHDTPRYMEIDFFSLSIYLLYDPFLMQDFTLEKHLMNRFSVINLYN
jgi:hypothetical protein